MIGISFFLALFFLFLLGKELLPKPTIKLNQLWLVSRIEGTKVQISNNTDIVAGSERVDGLLCLSRVLQ
jgi:hypothetical protein